MDIEKAKLELNRDRTIVLVKRKTMYFSQKKGISPMLDFLTEEIDLKGFSVADKIVGKAAAMLFVKVGIKEVYAEVLSCAGKMYLENNHVPVSWNTLTEKIINREGTGMCPMEETVLSISDPEEAYAALKRKVEELKKN